RHPLPQQRSAARCCPRPCCRRTSARAAQRARRHPARACRPLPTGHRMKLRAGDTLVVASHNKGKVREIIDLLAPLRLHVFSAADIDIEEPEETEATFAGNAALKARWVADRCGHMALSDDSGLAVAALDGAPGIYSARWAGPDKDFA